MSHRGRRSRPLGSVRRSLTGTEPALKLPPLTSPSHSIDRSYQGISGNAMSVPPPRASPERAEREEIPKAKTPLLSGRQTSSSRSAGSKSDDSANQELKKDLRDALSREKQLKAQITALQKTIEGQQTELEEKTRANEALQEQIEKLIAQEAHYKELYEKEVIEHNKTKEKLSTCEDLIFARDREISQLKLTHEEKIKELNIQMEKRVSAVEKAKDAEIATRDEKLKRLKSQMADALRGNSWERQQQLDELSKELTRAQEEADMLRMKMKAMARNGAKTSPSSASKGIASCANCDALSSRIQHLERTVTEKDKIIRDLKGISAKFEKQLNQKEVISQLKNGK